MKNHLGNIAYYLIDLVKNILIVLHERDFRLYMRSVNMFSGQFGNDVTRNIECSEVYSGRFLAIYLNNTGILTLCEVQVFGCK